jgi:hypothetical protein
MLRGNTVPKLFSYLSVSPCFWVHAQAAMGHSRRKDELKIVDDLECRLIINIII